MAVIEKEGEGARAECPHCGTVFRYFREEREERTKQKWHNGGPADYDCARWVNVFSHYAVVCPHERCKGDVKVD